MIAGSVAIVAITGMVAASRAEDGKVNFTNNAVASVVMNSYQATEDFTVNAWNHIENFFVKK